MRFSRLDYLILTLLSIAASWFLMRLAYLPVYQSTLAIIALLALTYWYLVNRFEIRVPISVMFLLVVAVEVDGIGNILGLYNTRFPYIQYDEYSHCLISLLVMPAVVWAVATVLEKRNARMPFGLTCTFAFAVVYSIAAFYEVIELWDDKYMHPVPGMRIHGPYDTANDLQWDLFGMALGTVLGYKLLKPQSSVKVVEVARAAPIIQEPADAPSILSAGSPGSTRIVLKEESRT